MAKGDIDYKYSNNIDCTIDPGDGTSQRATLVATIPAGGSTDVNVQDQTTDVVDLKLCNHLNTISLAVNASLDDTVITLTAGHSIVAGDTICLKEGTRFYQAQALSVAVNDITVDQPLDFAFTTSASGYRGSADMNVDGSTTPVIFKIEPPDGVKWDIVRFILVLRDATAMDDGKFGGLTALTNGIVIRKINGTWKNIFNAKTNGDFGLRNFDATYIDDTLGPSGEYGFRTRRTFGGQNKNGVVIRLDGEDDSFQLIVQDDLTGLTFMEAVAQGHVVD